MDGSWGLGIPTKRGQRMEVKPIEESKLIWRSFDESGQLWYEHSFKLRHGRLHTHAKDPITKQLLELFNQAHLQNVDFLRDASGYEVNTNLEFPIEWGLGSSSTLINNLANWAGINPYTLLKEGFGGSGYDIAVAQLGQPLLYRWQDYEPEIKAVDLPWEFTEQLHFIYLNEKSDSRLGIKDFGHQLVSTDDMKRISSISQELVTVRSLEVFTELVEAHEEIVSRTMQIPTQKQQRFPDYPGCIKSLGAWGGDIILASGTDETMDYFRKKGYDTIFNYTDLIA